ncbi:MULTISPECIES: ribonuclease P protein component [unclassified Dysgonomonas]|uniref:ribonuclease P protein component n=1 Tax=unclassified Dysgonomonas TaxID=2630389 RepID=UPI0013EC640B|nr:MULTISPECIES: ribonuclease P protein component [unclassified Dysgonomonas]
MIENSTPSNTFPKNEKLCSQKSIDRLFAQGESFIAYPLRVVYFVEDELNEEKQVPTVLASVSKKKFKRAVKRNRVKRLIREAYRLNKQPIHDLLKVNGKRLEIAFLYLKDELPTYGEIEKSMLKTINQLSDRFENK